jgi:Concanavalin A-like lectin/glucanases superfamily
MVASLIQFTQGATVGTAGQALIGVQAVAVQVANGASVPGAVILWTFSVVSVPTGSGVPIGIVQTGATPTWSFTPDLRGCYLIQLTVSDVLGNTSTDTRAFGIYSVLGSPYIVPSFSADAGSLNFGGQTKGWDPAMEAWLLLIGSGSSGPTGVPTDGLTLSLQANLGAIINPSSTSVVAWYSQAPGYYGTYVANGASSFPTLETSSVAAGYAVVFTDSIATGLVVPSSLEHIVSTNAFSFAGVISYTGAQTFNTANLRNGAMVVGLGTNAAFGPSVVVGTDPSSSGFWRIIVYISPSDGGTYQFVESALIPNGDFARFVCTYGGTSPLDTTGTFNLYVNGNAVVTAGPFTKLTFTDIQAVACWVGANESSSDSNFDGSIVEVDCWNRCLSSSEVTQEMAWLTTVMGS